MPAEQRAAGGAVSSRNEAGGREEEVRGQRRLRHRFRVGSRSRRCQGRRDPRRPARRDASATTTSAPASISRPTEFWERMTAPNAPFPKTAGVEPGRLQGDLRRGVRRAAPTRSSRSMSPGTLSGAIKSAEIARSTAAGSRDPRRRLAGRIDGRGRSSPSWASRWRRSGVSAEPRSPGPDRPRLGPPDVRLARDARVPEEGRPDQRRPGGDRDAALGQADHRRRGRRRRDGRQAADAGEVTRALHRADLRPADRAARDPPHDGPRRRRVPRRGHPPRRGSIRRRDDLRSSVRRSGRTSARAASARRSSTSADAGRGSFAGRTSHRTGPG